MSRTPSVPLRFQRPSLPSADRIERYFRLSRADCWFSNGGPCCELLTTRLRERTGCAPLPVSSGTLGLFVAVAALARRRPGTEALVPSFTFAAPAQALAWNGLQPVFVDVDPDHWHLCPESLRRALADRGDNVSIVLACSSFGTPPPSAVRRGWEDACRDANVPLLIDSAAGFGGVAEDGVPVGAQGDAEVVSFHATKPLAIGEGGAVFSHDQSLVDEMTRLANFCLGEGHLPQEARGLNAKLDEIHAAMALAALDDFDGVLAARRQRAGDLINELAPALSAQHNHERSTFQFVPLLARDHLVREDILARAAGSVVLRTYYQPLHRACGFLHGPHAGPLTVTDDLSRRIVSLPMFPDMSENEVRTIVDVVSGALG